MTRGRGSAAGMGEVMTRRIALLRAVNVSGTGKLSMADLARLATDLGFGAPKTLLQSGNLVFEAGAMADAEVEARLAAGLAERLLLSTDVFVRDPAAWARIVADNPMKEEAQAAPSGFLLFALKAPAPDSALARLRAAAVDGERVEAGERCLYAFFPNGLGRSRMGAMLSGKGFAVPGTGRNWNTVRKLAELVGG